MKFNYERLVLNILLTLNGLGIGAFIIQKDYLFILGSIGIFLIILVNEGDLYK